MSDTAPATKGKQCWSDHFIKFADIKCINNCHNNQVPKWPVGSSQDFWLSNPAGIYGEPQGALS